MGVIESNLIVRVHIRASSREKAESIVECCMEGILGAESAPWKGK